MPNPTLINGRYYLRLHVPHDIAYKAHGKKLYIPVAEQMCAVTVGRVVKVSLQTSRYDEAKARFTHAHAAVVKQWDAIRKGPVTVPHRTLVALAGLRDTTMKRNEVVKQDAQRRATDLRGVLLPMRQAGKSLREIAAELSRFGVKTARGGEWTAAQVSRHLARLET